MEEMRFVLVVARIVLSAIFAVASVAKLLDRPGTENAFVNFGIPGWLAKPCATLIPIVELAVAVALLVVPLAWFGAVGALVLLIVFSLSISFNLANGRRPDCNCFGQIQSKPIGWSTLLRNLALLVLAGIVVWQGPNDPGPSLIQWLEDFPVATRIGIVGGVIGIALLIAMVVLTLQLLRQQAKLLLRLDGLEARLPASNVPPVGLAIGSKAPALSLATVDRKTMTLDELVASGKQTLLLFAKPNCEPCKAIMPTVFQWQQQQSLTIAVICEGSAQDNQDKIEVYGLSSVLLQREREITLAYGVLGTPAAVLISRAGLIASSVAHGADDIHELVARATSDL